MLQRALERAYRNLGPRYRQRAVTGQLQLIHAFLLLNICALGLYVELGSREFALLVASAVAGMAVYNALYARVARLPPRSRKDAPSWNATRPRWTLDTVRATIAGLGYEAH